MNKKGLSPIVATILLITLALILAAIVFIWASSFIGEKAQKQGTTIENKCPEINFAVDAVENLQEGGVDISVQNNGNIPLYGVEIRKRSFGSILGIDSFDTTISNGETVKGFVNGEVKSGDEIVAVPMILGEINGATKSYTCKEDYGVVITVKSA